MGVPKADDGASKRRPELSQRPRGELVLSVVLFFLVFFLFMRKISVAKPPPPGLEKDFGSYRPPPAPNVLKGKPYNPDLYALSVDFASEEAGAKIIAHSKSLCKLSNILNSGRDTYMLAPCRTTDWFVLSFPETILIQQVSFLSCEFYASTYKSVALTRRNIRISVSNVYPSSKWLTLAEIETEPSGNEVFDLSVLCGTEKNDCWGKYLKVELLDYHRVEDNYYCSITKMAVYGVTAVEYLETEIAEDRAGDEAPQPQAAGRSSKPEDPAVHRTPDAADPAARRPKSSVHPTPTFVYDFKNTIRNALYKFLMTLALRPDPGPHNRRLVQRILKFGRFKKYCGTNLLFHFDCNRFISYLLLEKYAPYYANVLDAVALPAGHSWFERVVFDFAKTRRQLIESIMNDVGVAEVPFLICLQAPGVVARFRCFFYFNLKSFSTLLFTEFSGGLRLLVDAGAGAPAPTHRLHFFYATNKIAAPRSATRRRTLARDNGRLAVREAFAVRDEFIAAVTVANDRLHVSLAPHATSSPRGPEPGDPRHSTVLAKVERNLYRVDYLTNVTRYLGGRSRFSMRSSFAKGPEPNAEFDHEDAGRKDHRAHKHVLLKLSERIKSLEYLNSKLSKRLFEIESLLHAGPHRFYAPDEVRRAHPQAQLKHQVEGELDGVLQMFGIVRFRLASRAGPGRLAPKSGAWAYYRRLSRHAGFELGHLYVRCEAAGRVTGRLCRLGACVPHGGRCRTARVLYNLSAHYRLFRRTRLLRCLLGRRCRCAAPRGAEAPASEWFLVCEADAYRRCLVALRAAARTLRCNLRRHLNLYLLFTLFLATQIFWVCKFNLHDKQIRKLAKAT